MGFLAQLLRRSSAFHTKLNRNSAAIMIFYSFDGSHIKMKDTMMPTFTNLRSYVEFYWGSERARILQLRKILHLSHVAQIGNQPSHTFKLHHQLHFRNLGTISGHTRGATINRLQQVRRPERVVVQGPYLEGLRYNICTL